MAEFAALGNIDLWHLHMDLAGMNARWGGTVKHKTMKALDAGLSPAHHRDNQRALEKLTQHVDGQLRIAPSPPLIVPIEDLISADEKEQQEETVRRFMHNYRSKLRGDRQRLLESYHSVDLARKVVGVGSVGTLTWVLLLLGRDETDPLFLQVKEAKTSVLEPYLGKSAYANHGRRVVEGQWLMQASSDIFLGWDHVESGIDGRSHDFYIRQLWDWKISLDVETMEPEEMMVYVKMCAWTLARAHARSGDPIAISAYLGEKDHIDNALAEFAVAYADQNERDYQKLIDAVEGGRIKAGYGG
jgi:hypothetical protein